VGECKPLAAAIMARAIRPSGLPAVWCLASPAATIPHQIVYSSFEAIVAAASLRSAAASRSAQSGAKAGAKRNTSRTMPSRPGPIVALRAQRCFRAVVDRIVHEHQQMQLDRKPRRARRRDVGQRFCDPMGACPMLGRELVVDVADRCDRWQTALPCCIIRAGQPSDTLATASASGCRQPRRGLRPASRATASAAASCELKNGASSSSISRSR
jgi:hypothetical protein